MKHAPNECKMTYNYAGHNPKSRGLPVGTAVSSGLASTQTSDNI